MRFWKGRCRKRRTCSRRRRSISRSWWTWRRRKQAAKGKDADIGKAIGQVCHEAAAKLKGWGRYANAVTLYLAAFNSAGDPVDRVESDLAQLSSSFAYYKAAMRIIYGRTLSDDLALKIVPILANLDTVAEDIRKLEAASPPDSASEKLGPLIAACRGALAEGWCLARRLLCFSEGPGQSQGRC